MCHARPSCRLQGQLAVIVVGLLVAPASAQLNNNWTNPGAGDWNTPTNWSEGFSPSSSLDEAANISNGGTAFLNSAAIDTPGEVILGENTGETGALEIRAGGNLTIVSAANANGGIDVGTEGGGTGALTVLPGGSLSVESFLDVFEGSSATFGGTGAGVAAVSTEFANFTADLRVIGPDVSFQAGTSVNFGPDSIYTAEITGPAHSALRASTGILRGTLRVEFNGYTPTLGDSWDLVDAVGIGGEFTSIDLSAAPALNPGEAYRVVVEPGGSRGTVASLKLDQILTLTVDRASGGLSIDNPGVQSIEIDGYRVTSTLGQLDDTNWNSVSAQIGGGWLEAPSSPTAVGELNPNSSSVIPGGDSLASSLGDLFAPSPPAFGIDVDEDIAFEYTTPDGDIVEGRVEFVGTQRFNNLVLFVDPDTGMARLRNDSEFFSVDIDGYTINSASGSLLTTWESLQDQEVGTWFEANPTSTQLTELLADAAETLAIGQSFELGKLFDEVSGQQDLVFQYLTPGESIPQAGIVVYGPLGPDGDFNDDGVVDGADYAVWRNNFGTTNTLPNDPIGGMIGVAQYDLWRDNFGAGAGGSGSQAGAGVTAAPEPATSVGLVLTIAALAIRTREKRAC